MRYLLFILVLLFLTAGQCYGQEYEVGLETGLITDPSFQSSGLNISGGFEFCFPNSRFSLNTSPGVIVARPDLIGSFPISLKYHIGNDWSFNPEIGAFYWTTNRWGGLAGLNIQKKMNDKWYPYITFRYLRVFYRYQTLLEENVVNDIRSLSALNFAAGIKYRIN